MMIIRGVSERDAQVLSDVLCASIRELCVADHGNDQETIQRWIANKSPGHIAQWITHPNLTLFLAERDGEPAGVGGISEGGEITLNYVTPAHRFHGVSRAVLAHCETALAAAGIRRARLVSTATAHRFYREAGWSDAGAPESVFGLVGYPMAKVLAPSDTALPKAP